MGEDGSRPEVKDGPCVAVAVGNPDHVEQLVRTALDVARARGGSVFVVGVVVTPRSSPFAMLTDEVIAREFGGERRAVLERAMEAAAGTDVPVGGRLFVAPSVWRGVLHGVEERDCEALVVGWQERSREEAVLGTNVDRIVSRADADVLVEKIGATVGTVETVRFPVAESPHADLAAEVARAIAVSNDADLHLLRVADSPGEEDRARGMLGGFAERFPGLSVETTVEVGDVADVVVAESSPNDVTVLGATRSGRIRSRVVGDTPQEVSQRAEGSVVVARRNRESRLPRLFRL